MAFFWVIGRLRLGLSVVEGWFGFGSAILTISHSLLGSKPSPYIIPHLVDGFMANLMVLYVSCRFEQRKNGAEKPCGSVECGFF